MNRPDLPFTGFGRLTRLAIDPVLLIVAFLIAAIAVAFPLTLREFQMLSFVILPVAVLRRR